MPKGDNPRPLSIPPEEFKERWERTFGGHARGTTCWYCECGEVLDGRTARTHECKETEDE